MLQSVFVERVVRMKTFPLDEGRLLEDISGLLRIKSVTGDCGPVTAQAPLGQGIYDAVEYLLSLGKSYGMRGKNLDGYCGWLEIGEGERMVAVLAHVDTVSVTPDGWEADPFDGTVIDGKLYGRGSLDNKGPAVVTLHAMKAILESGVKLDKRIRLIFGGDEEMGAWRCMERYRQTEELPCCAFAPDVVYPVTYAEKGIMRVCISRQLDGVAPVMELQAGTLPNIVPDYAKAQIGGEVYEATGKPAHAMEPHKGDNAIVKLCRALDQKGLRHPFIQMCCIADRDGFGIAFSDEGSGELTINPSLATVDSAHAELTCDVRIPVTITSEQVVEAISRQVEPFGFTVERTFWRKPLYISTDSPLVKTLQAVYLDCTGDSRPPVSTGGITFARAFENAVAFGALFPDDPVTYHKTNEFWKVDSIKRNFQIISNALLAL